MTDEPVFGVIVAAFSCVRQLSLNGEFSDETAFRGFTNTRANTDFSQYLHILKIDENCRNGAWILHFRNPLHTFLARACGRSAVR
jgi:hypothetical protein